MIMKTLNATLLAALIAIPAVSFADGGAEPFVNIHSTATASEVRAQLAGTRAGINEIDAGLIVVNDSAPKTRAQVLAELAEATRLGLVQRGDVTLVETPEQRAQIAAAGVRALNADRVASKASVAALIASPSVAQ
jgi:D-serine deaminase-like pyridoxal phosphate-dependent protein